MHNAIWVIWPVSLDMIIFANGIAKRISFCLSHVNCYWQVRLVETLLISGDPRRHDGCRCTSTKSASDHQQPPAIELYYAICNRIWWLCLVPTSTTRFACDLWYRLQNGQKFNRVIQDKYLLWTMRSNSLSKNEERDILLHICMLVWSQTLVVNWQN